MTAFICTIPVLAGVLAVCAMPPPLGTGYVEGELVLMAPVAVTQVEDVPVRRGQRVTSKTVLARMARRDAEITLAQAEASVVQAESELADLKKPRRAEEIRAIEAELVSAQAQPREAAKEASRLRELLQRGFVPQSQMDFAETRLDVAEARVAEVKANLTVAHLPAREQQIAAAEAVLAVAVSHRDMAKWQLEERDILGPSSGTVTEIFGRRGEIAGPQAPVLSFLPDGAVILRLYVHEQNLADLAVGSVFAVNCDGCPPTTSATVTYVSEEPEFTPPVIYSVENRQKLVYLVEAQPDPGAAILKPGQIVDVRLAGQR